jgi:hypothetical protein
MKMPLMKRPFLYLITASLTFCLGIIVATLRLTARHQEPPVVQTSESSTIQQEGQPEITRRPLTFVGVRCPNKTCTRDTRVCYESSDGVLVTVIAQTYKSTAEAKEWLQLSLKNASENAGEIVERAPKLNAKGRRIGERVVVRHAFAPPERESVYSIEWTHGANLDIVYSPSLNHALEFEKAFLSGRLKLHSYFDFNLPPPNNGVHRTADTPALK